MLECSFCFCCVKFTEINGKCYEYFLDFIAANLALFCMYTRYLSWCFQSETCRLGIIVTKQTVMAFFVDSSIFKLEIRECFPLLFTALPDVENHSSHDFMCRFGFTQV